MHLLRDLHNLIPDKLDNHCIGRSNGGKPCKIRVSSEDHQRAKELLGALSHNVDSTAEQYLLAHLAELLICEHHSDRQAEVDYLVEAWLKHRTHNTNAQPLPLESPFTPSEPFTGQEQSHKPSNRTLTSKRSAKQRQSSVAVTPSAANTPIASHKLHFGNPTAELRCFQLHIVQLEHKIDLLNNEKSHLERENRALWDDHLDAKARIAELMIAGADLVEEYEKLQESCSSLENHPRCAQEGCINSLDMPTGHQNNMSHLTDKIERLGAAAAANVRATIWKQELESAQDTNLRLRESIRSMEENAREANAVIDAEVAWLDSELNDLRRCVIVSSARPDSSSIQQTSIRGIHLVKGLCH